MSVQDFKTSLRFQLTQSLVGAASGTDFICSNEDSLIRQRGCLTKVYDRRIRYRLTFAFSAETKFVFQAAAAGPTYSRQQRRR